MRIARSVSLQVNSLSFHLVKKSPVMFGLVAVRQIGAILQTAGRYPVATVSSPCLLSLLCSLPMPLFDLAGRVTSARGVIRMLWLSGGAVAMAFGIRSMHYIGMLPS